LFSVLSTVQQYKYNLRVKLAKTESYMLNNHQFYDLPFMLPIVSILLLFYDDAAVH